ncbi:mucin-2-like [Scylla paramamosain]|uniref:mucin-2-like n=1 Tax=Scylla paramamosain TaxID=85552 RepID=UPI003082F813
MNLPGCLLAALALLTAAPTRVSLEKLSVLLPNQNAEFDLEHELELDLDPRTGAPRQALSPPPGLPIPSISQLPLAAPPAPLPTGPPASPEGRITVLVQDQAPRVTGLYELPEEFSPEGSSQGTCEAQTLVVTSRDVVVSTSISWVTVPTTVVQRYTTTQIQLQTALQTSYVTLPAIVQTSTLTSVVPTTVYRTSTRYQQQVVTSTQVRLQTQLVTSRVTDYRTETQTRIVYQTVYSTRVQPTYITTTVTQQITPSCPPLLIPTPTSVGYDYAAPTSTYGSGQDYSPSYSASSGNTYGVPVYGPFYHAYQALSRKKRLLKEMTFGG